MFEVELENGGKLKSKSVIVATGARWRELNVPGEKEFKGKGVAYCPHCDGPLFKGKHVAVIGGETLVLKPRLILQISLGMSRSLNSPENSRLMISCKRDSIVCQMLMSY